MLWRDQNVFFPNKLEINGRVSASLWEILIKVVILHEIRQVSEDYGLGVRLEEGLVQPCHFSRV